MLYLNFLNSSAGRLGLQEDSDPALAERPTVAAPVRLPRLQRDRNRDRQKELERGVGAVPLIQPSAGSRGCCLAGPAADCPDDSDQMTLTRSFWGSFIAALYMQLPLK